MIVNDDHYYKDKCDCIIEKGTIEYYTESYKSHGISRVCKSYPTNYRSKLHQHHVETLDSVCQQEECSIEENIYGRSPFSMQTLIFVSNPIYQRGW